MPVVFYQSTYIMPNHLIKSYDMLKTKYAAQYIRVSYLNFLDRYIMQLNLNLIFSILTIILTFIL